MICDVASIVFVCVTMNHLGLVSAIEGIIGCRLPIINCVKCSSFWATLALCFGKSDLLTVFAISFLASYSAIWVELLEAFIDHQYMKLYGKIYPTNCDTAAPSADNGNPDGTVSNM